MASRPSSHAEEAHYLALACDGDGTLTTRKILASGTRLALERWRNSGRKLILVTGETIEELNKFPHLSAFNLVVAENGALLYWPSDKKTKPLAERTPPSLIRTLRRRRVNPLTLGHTMVGTCRPRDAILKEEIEHLQLDWEVLYNRKEAMALPRGIDKASGLCAGLGELGLASAAVVGVGDGQNDVDLLKCCGFGAAVCTAVASLKEAANLTLSSGSGRGVAELIDRILSEELPSENNLRELSSRPRFKRSRAD
jgi:hydroxymethylpyrimidine pyrophosphatase-like HAD family hydrolase